MWLMKLALVFVSFSLYCADLPAKKVTKVQTKKSLDKQMIEDYRSLFALQLQQLAAQQKEIERLHNVIKRLKEGTRKKSKPKTPNLTEQYSIKPNH